MAELHGFEAMLAAIRAQIDNVRDATPDALAQAAHYLEAVTKVTLTTTSHARGTPTPSAPGEPPSLISGALPASVQVDGPTGGGGRWEARVGATPVYARIQELGGQTGRGHRTTLPPRPYLAPSVDRSTDQIGRYLADAWGDAL